MSPQVARGASSFSLPPLRLPRSKVAIVPVFVKRLQLRTRLLGETSKPLRCNSMSNLAVACGDLSQLRLCLRVLQCSRYCVWRIGALMFGFIRDFGAAMG